MGFGHIWYLDMSGVFWQTPRSRSASFFCALHQYGQVERYRIRENEGEFYKSNVCFHKYPGNRDAVKYHLNYRFAVNAFFASLLNHLPIL